MNRLLAVMLACVPLWAAAHKPSDSYLSLRLDGSELRGQWDIALRDLEYAIGLDEDGDGAITWGELRRRRDEVARYVLERLEIDAQGRRCSLTPTDQLVDEHSDGAYAVVRFRADCGPDEIRTLGVGYRLFFDLDPTHRGLLNLQGPGLAVTAVFSPERQRQSLTLAGVTRTEQFLAYAREGVWHIWIGIDHVLFLVSLLLPAVLVPSGRGWRPAERFAPAFWDVFRVVTSFTLAHSLTLALAAASVVALPSRLVESLIALSVVLAALNNIRPVVHEARWVVAFAFGLIHGFGFASVLADLGLPRDAFALALVGFNLGVEAGQLAVVAAFLPLAFWLRERWVYRRMIFAGGSAAIVLVAAAWMTERAFDLRLLPG
jgi:hypothetical protein